MIKVSLADDSLFAMVAAANVITKSQVGTIKRKFAELARATESEAKQMAMNRLTRTAQQYRDALTFEKTATDTYELRLDKAASHLESGYGGYDMKPGMLNSKATVKSGKRAGQPWVRKSKEGFLYAIVPMEQSMKAANPGHPLNGAGVQIGQPTETTMGNLASDMKTLLKSFGASSRKKGEPNSGHAWTMIKGAGDEWTMKSSFGLPVTKDVPGINGLLSGLTKENAQVGSKTQGKYNTFRVVSNNPKAKGKWQHPGFGGVKIFPDLENWVRGKLETIVRETLGAP